MDPFVIRAVFNFFRYSVESLVAKKSLPSPQNLAENDENTVFTQLVQELCDVFEKIYFFDAKLENETKELFQFNKNNVFGSGVSLELIASSSVLSHLIVQQKESASVILDASDFLKLLPVLFSVRSLSLSSVFHISCGSYGDREFDLSCLMSIKDVGIGTLLSSSSLQEIQDITFITNLIAQKLNVPMIHCFGKSKGSGSPTLASSQNLLQLLQNSKELLTDKDESTDQIEPLYLRTLPEDSSTFDSIIENVENVFTSFESQTKRKYNLFEQYGSQNASLLVVVTGILNQLELNQHLENLSKQGKEIRVVVVRLYRPWSTKHFLSTLSEKVEHIIVLEQTQKKSSPQGFTPLYNDVVSSLVTDQSLNKITITYHAFPLDELSIDALSQVYDKFKSNHLQNFSFLNENESATNVTKKNQPNIDQESEEAIQQYFSILQQTIGKDVTEIYSPLLNSPDNVSGNIQETESAEYAFGLYLDRENQRNKLINWVKDNLQSFSEEIRTLLSSWLENDSNLLKSNEISNQIINLLNNNENDNQQVNYLKEKQFLLSNKSYWILGTENWSFDLMSSGIHTIIKSNKNINLLIVNTTLIDKNTNTRRKDVGLYAMNYGTSFVGAVAPYGSYSQLVRVISEANDFKGSSIILAYSPILPINDRKDNKENPNLFSLKETKKAIDSGLWPLYRYNPNKSDANLFELDSNKIKKNIEDFLKRENQLTLLSNEESNFGSNSIFSTNLNSEINQKHLAVLSSYEQLLSNMQAPNKSVIILFGSDGGRAEEAAKRLATDANILKYSSRVLPMNDIQWEEVINEENFIIFVISTAGQGEFPSNSKASWKILEEADENLLNFKGIEYGVFALGDSHYWPKPEEKVFFCKPGRDVDLKIEELGGKRIISLGLGDDQDDDGWETAYELWRNELWNSLISDEKLISKLPGSKKKIPTDDEIKNQSNFLRGTIAEGLLDESTLALSYENTKLTKFHGIYQQDDRDLREQRRKEGKEKAFSFMVRIRAPAGVCTSKQWQMVDTLASKYGNETFKLTTRQAVQLHGILKFNLKQTIQDINRELMDTLAACGDVNRNVMCNPNPDEGNEIFNEIHKISCNLSEYLTPRTSAYHEIWLDKKKVSGDEIGDIEPIYGPNYLPRKFKIAIAIPPHNDVDVLAHCLGFIAIIDKTNNKLEGFNVTIGGGMGMTHNNTKTFPRLADTLGFCTPDQVVPVSEAVLIIQRDFGDRTNRKHARLKYTVEDNGISWYREKVEEYLGFKLQDPKNFNFISNGDRFGWKQGSNSLWHFTLWVENGRVRDIPGYLLRTALLELSKIHTGEFRITPNQNLIISNVTEENKLIIDDLFKKYHINNEKYSSLRLNSIACVALPTCGLALAESERYLPVLIDKLDSVLDRVGLRHDAITIRMSGCPNGCSRPYVAEIALVGRAPGIYNLYLGGGFSAERLCKLYKDSVNEDEIIEALTPLFEQYASDRNENEKFGDFVIRKNIVKETLSGSTFHDK